MYEEKKEYLKLYLIQESKISSLRELAIKKPNKSIEYYERIVICENMREEIEEKIFSLDDPLLSEILCQKYILGKTLEEISLILNYSKRHIERLHIKALGKFIM